MMNQSLGSLIPPNPPSWVRISLTRRALPSTSGIGVDTSR